MPDALFEASPAQAPFRGDVAGDRQRRQLRAPAGAARGAAFELCVAARTLGPAVWPWRLGNEVGWAIVWELRVPRATLG
ncbi:MAG TPA: hypothetical protein VFE11_15305, partial [Dongiaceae bacterium]|nr:hypothetical protein [Dongiaceae bacterium]